MKLHLPKKKMTTQYLYCQRNFSAPVPFSVHSGVANFRCQYSSVQITWPTENFGRQEAAFVHFCLYYGVSKRDLSRNFRQVKFDLYTAVQLEFRY
jgi:hypothetical protein